MNVRLDYGSSGLPVEFPSHNTTVIEPARLPALADPHRVLSEVLESPIGRPPLRTLVQPGMQIGISVCDITRAQPRQLMLETLFGALPETRLEDVTIFIATGTHRANTRSEIEAMLGTQVMRDCRIVCHDSRDKAMLVRVGATSTGVPILLNRLWVESEFKITTGFVEPHFFAGFSGGPKMVAPGLAGLETVMHLHDADRIAHPDATWGITEGNPIHDDVREIARMTGVDFALDVTLDRDQNITAAFAGDLFKEHASASARVRQTAMRSVSQLFDVVVTTNSGYPLDQNLYQTVKGMSAASRIVKPGGTIVCAAECRDGIPGGGAYARLLLERPSPGELLELVTSPDFAQPDQWQVQVQAQIQLRARVLLKSDSLSDSAIRAAHFEPIDDVGAAVRSALRSAGPEASLCVLPQGPQTIPYLA